MVARQFQLKTTDCGPERGHIALYDITEGRPAHCIIQYSNLCTSEPPVRAKKFKFNALLVFLSKLQHAHTHTRYTPSLLSESEVIGTPEVLGLCM